MIEPHLRVGLALDCNGVRLTLRGDWRLFVGERDAGPITGPLEVGPDWPGTADHRGALLRLEPISADAEAVVHDMTVGRAFHWQHEEDLVFQGVLTAAWRPNGLFDLVNEAPLEHYLESVVSSEMSARCPPALLRAHAVISRSWLLAQLEGGAGGRRQTTQAAIVQGEDGALELRRWYDREDHAHFDVCADDHCQRYQGVTRAFTPEAAAAVAATRGQVLTSNDRVCDARFAKCCGGMTEVFASAWGDVEVPYLRAFADRDGPPDFELPLTHEAHAVAFIEGAPTAWCNTRDRALLERLLPDLDHETRDFYRWQERLSADKVRALVLQKAGVDLGPVLALTPLERGPSGRVVKLEIRGEAATLRVGKELEIRRLLSETHLYSSAFVVHREPGGFRLRGAGWGHGVGLCQIGAAVMADAGYEYGAILAHYYRGARLERRY